jgi:hypothetical protein
MVRYVRLLQILVGRTHPLHNEDDPNSNVPGKLLVRVFDGLMAAVV